MRHQFGERDPLESLDEDREELLRRMRVALEPLTFEGIERREDVVQRQATSGIASPDDTEN